MKKSLTNLLLALALVSTSFAGDAKSAYSDISHDDLKKAIEEKKVTLIDVNGSESFKAGHIPGAIDYAANKEKLAELLPNEKDALIVAYCGNEHCGAYKKGADQAKELGYTNVKHYSGGIAGWKAKEAAPAAM